MVYVFLADGFEEIEALTPVDILRRAQKDVYTVGVNGKTVIGSHGIPIVCDMILEEIRREEIEMIVLPGGMPGTINLEKSQPVLDIVKYASENKKWIAAICAAPTILGHLGLLKNCRATCHPDYQEQLDAKVVDVSVCIDGKFITARDMTQSLAFSQKLAEIIS